MALSLTVYMFISDLAGRGIKLVAQGDRIGIVAEAGKKLSNHDRLFIKHWRKELLAALDASPEEFSAMAALAIFDGVPVGDDSGAFIAAYNALADGMVTCDFCGAERNAEIPRCWRCFPSVWDEVLGPAPTVPRRSIEEMVETIVAMTDEERAELRTDLANAPDDDPVHTFEQVALERAERALEARNAGEPGTAA